MSCNGYKAMENRLLPETVWVFGGGQFGKRAVELLRRTTPSCTLVVIDRNPSPELPKEIEIVCADGVEWLVNQFTSDAAVTKIIPALPLHLVVEWMKKKFLGEGLSMSSVDIPDELFRHFPHPFRLSSDQIVTSNSDFICPPDCPEPDECCTYTKLRRPQSLNSLLATMDCGPFVPLIVKSRQFAPGVGGFFPDDLWNLLECVRLLPGTPLLIGTACKCHGIVNGLSLTSL